MTEEKSSLSKTTLWMGLGTLLSRITGFGRLAALVFALGSTRLTDSYNLANNTPNMVYDLILGGVIAATLIPVFVELLNTKAEKEAWDGISAIVTIFIVILIVITGITVVIAPDIIHLYALANTGASKHSQEIVATELLRLFAPELAFYGIISITSSLLAVRRKFILPMFTPIANNLLVIGVFILLPHIVHTLTLQSMSHHQIPLLFLGLGTTAGVGLQAILQLPALREIFRHLHWNWNLKDPVVKNILNLSGWTFGFVAANQVTLFIILALANAIKGQVTDYNNAYSFFQLPFGIVAVSIMNLIQPDLSSKWYKKDLEGFRYKFSEGIRLILVLIIPSAVGFVLLAHPIINTVLLHGSMTVHQANITGSIFAFFGLGLPGFSVYLFLMRVYQSMQHIKEAFFLYLIKNSVNLILAFSLYNSLHAKGLAISLSIAYSVGSIVAIWYLHKLTFRLRGKEIVSSLVKISFASLVMGIAIYMLENFLFTNWNLDISLPLTLLSAVLVYVITARMISIKELDFLKLTKKKL